MTPSFSEKYPWAGMATVIVLWIVCGYFGIFFTRIEDGM